MTVLFTISSALIAGLLMSRIIKPLKLPAITAYLLAGILIGPFLLGRIGIEGLGFASEESINHLSILSDVALGFIAFAIGNEFRLSQLKKTGRQATVIGIFQALTATLIVDAVLIIVHFIFPDKLSISAVITLGAIASATAPAATLMVVRQYKAKGPLTDLLLPIVAIDDAVGLIIFAVSFGIAKALSSGVVDIVSIIINPIIEIIASLVVGLIGGILLTFIERFFHSRSKRMSISITFVLALVAVCMLKTEIGNVSLSFSPLLSCMMMGTIFCNLCETSEELMERTDGWTTPLFIIFFVISGAELDLNVFADKVIILVGIIYILTRISGKYLGTYISAGWVNCDKSVQRYLGITLMPQAGVALGMSQTAANILGADGNLIRNIILFAVMVYELVGPMMTKISLTAVGDIKPGSSSARRKNNNSEN